MCSITMHQLLDSMLLKNIKKHCAIYKVKINTAITEHFYSLVVLIVNDLAVKSGLGVLFLYKIFFLTKVKVCNIAISLANIS